MKIIRSSRLPPHHETHKGQNYYNQRRNRGSDRHAKDFTVYFALGAVVVPSTPKISHQFYH